MDIQVADTLLGSLIDGRYRIRGRVARGGVATVYTATDERLERTVALKIIHPTQAPQTPEDGGHFLTRFTEEAKTIARLTHPNVVAVYDQGTHNGLPYLVMEYVRGRTLRDVLIERNRLKPDEALAVTEQMLAALAAAHRAGLVHRDVKPENVLVAEAPSSASATLVDSVVKVADFGLARAVEASDEAGNQLMATVAYVPPELVSDGRADPRSDVYSAGIVLFEMLTGRVPYDQGRAVDIAWQHVDRDVPPPSTLVPGLPPLVDELVLRATRRDPQARPGDAAAFLAEVQATREGLTSAQSSTTVLPKLPPSADQTMIVAAVSPAERPAWARLPETKARQQPHRRRAVEPAVPAEVTGPGDGPLGDPRRRTAIIAAAVVLGLVAMIGGWWFGVGRYTSTPQLVNLTKAEAQELADRGGFTLAYDTPRYDPNSSRDTVLSQDPSSTERVVKGGTITLVLSLGPESVRVPDVVGKTFELAQAELRNSRLKAVKGTARYDDDLPEGVVIDVDPAVGEEVKPDQEITLVLSKGRAPLSVPNLVGKNINEARAALTQLGLVPVETYKDSDRPKDEVLAQSPSNGSGVEAGAQVKLEVSNGPAAVAVPKVIDMPCQEAKALLESQQFAVSIQLNPNGTVRFQNPGENAQVAPGTQITIGCI